MGEREASCEREAAGGPRPNAHVAAVELHALADPDEPVTAAIAEPGADAVVANLGDMLDPAKTGTAVPAD